MSKKKFKDLSRYRKVGGDPDGRFMVFVRDRSEEIWGNMTPFNLERDGGLHAFMSSCFLGKEVLMVDSSNWSAVVA